MRNAKAAANEHIRAVQTQLEIDNGNVLPFLCECDDEACRTIIRLTAAAYSDARESGRFVVAKGHRSEGRVVDTGEGYAVVEE